MHFLAILGFELRALRMGGWPGEEPAWESDHTGLSGSVWGMSGMWTDGISTGLCWLLTWLLWAISSPVKLQQHSMEPLLEARRGSQEVSRVPSLGTFMWWCILGASPKLSLVMGSGPFPWGHCSPNLFYYCVCGVGDWTQGLVHARQVPYHFSDALSSFIFYFWDSVSSPLPMLLLDLGSSYLHLSSSWDYRCESSHLAQRSIYLTLWLRAVSK
jgi:hypothetical protein